MRKFFLFFLSIFFLGTSVFPSFARAEAPSTTDFPAVNVYFFYGQGCPHCTKEEPFLQTIQTQYPSVKIQTFEVWYDADNQTLLQKVGETLGVTIGGVPFTVVGNRYVSGYYNDETTGKEISTLITSCLSQICEDPLAAFIDVSETEVADTTSAKEETPAVVMDVSKNDLSASAASVGEESSQEAEPSDALPADEGKTATVHDIEIHLPILGTIHSSSFSLPVLTVMIGALDGFNPCAMWTLIFLISLLVNMRNKKRMWILGGSFVFASGLVYFLFLSAWLNVFLFIGMIVWVRLLIGVIALASGGYNLREYMNNKDGTCKVTAHKDRKKIFDRLRAAVHHQQFWVALIGIVLLAFAVNLVELVCSAGLPAVYTQVLALNHLPSWQYYGYLLLYLFFFLLDDLFVFFVSMITLQVMGITSKYSRFSYLIGGILMLVLGALLILRPELLMFG